MNTDHVGIRPFLAGGLFCASLLASIANLPGQASAPGSSPASANKGEIVQLSEFTVSADRDVGYSTTNAIGVTRTNTPIIDTPQAVNVINRNIFFAGPERLIKLRAASGFLMFPRLARRKTAAHRGRFRRLAWLAAAGLLALAALSLRAQSSPPPVAPPRPVSSLGYPDISAYTPDLEPPRMSTGEPGAGRRTRATLPAFRHTDVYYSLYLPADWKPGALHPVIVEYAGNGDYRSRYGDVCTGRVEDCSLGYGLSGGRGCIWICLPFVDAASGTNAIRWWGNIEATVDFCREAVRTVCAEFGGDASAVFLCGFSRGAIACNHIGLHNDAIAQLWRGFFAASHYDGPKPAPDREWPYPGSDRAAARVRLDRLGRRPVFVSHEAYGVEPETYTIVDTINYLAGTGRPLDNFRFQVVPLRNHTDRWVLYDLPARRNLRRWFQDVLASPAGHDGRSTAGDPASRERPRN